MKWNCAHIDLMDSPSWFTFARRRLKWWLTKYKEKDWMYILDMEKSEGRNNNKNPSVSRHNSFSKRQDLISKIGPLLFSLLLLGNRALNKPHLLIDSEKNNNYSRTWQELSLVPVQDIWKKFLNQVVWGIHIFLWMAPWAFFLIPAPGEESWRTYRVHMNIILGILPKCWGYHPESLSIAFNYFLIIV